MLVGGPRHLTFGMNSTRRSSQSPSPQRNSAMPGYNTASSSDSSANVGDMARQNG
jgi:hypothetical protein